MTAAPFVKRVCLDSPIPRDGIKKTDAITEPLKLGEVQGALAVRGLQGIVVTEIQGAGRQEGSPSLHRGAEYAIDLRHEVKLEIPVPALPLTGVWETARMGHIGDGKIFVTRIQEVVRIRAGERGAEAIQ
jgi:nitrogen regulatory protein PII